jgi:hypothetical protein
MTTSHANGAVLFATGSWVALLWSGSVASNPWIAAAAIIVAYALTCVGLVRVARPEIAVHAVVQACCILVVALFAFTTWGLVVASVPLDLIPKRFPTGARFFALLIPAVVATMTTTLLLLMPVSLLLRRHFWLPPMIALAIWVWVSGDWPIVRAGATIGQSVLVLEQLSLGLVTPVLLMWIAPRLRQRMVGAM